MTAIVKVRPAANLLGNDLPKDIFAWMSKYSKHRRFQKEVGEGHSPCRGGAAIGYVTKEGTPVLVAKNLNSKLPDFWEEDSQSQYGAYAAYKCITALMNKRDTVDTGEDFSFDGAVHAGACIVYLPEWEAWVCVAFSGFESTMDKEIAGAALKEFFETKK